MKPKQWVGVGLLMILGLAVLLWLGANHPAQAARALEEASVTRGAMLYDRWFAVLNVEAPEGDMPLWVTQSANTRSGADTWRCVTCHGWDYQGKAGANRSGSNYTGFPGVIGSKDLSADEIAALLQGKTNPQHDFSAYLSAADFGDLAVFLNTALIDDSQYIDPITFKIIGGDLASGKALYDSECASCHGSDGAKLKFRYEGRDASLGTLAVLDPWRFLHKTRYGTPGTDMVVGADLGWTPENGRDVLLYAQSLPSGLEQAEIQPPMSGREGVESSPTGGPAGSVFTGILTALGAMVTSLGFAVLLGAFLVGVIFLVVWLIRDRKNK